METNETSTTFLCLFHSPAHAESALSALEKAGFPRNSVTSTWNNGDTDRRTGDTGELARMGVPERDIEHLQQGLADGGVLLGLRALESRSDEIERIFHRYSADKIDEADVDDRLPGDRLAEAAPIAALAVAAAPLAAVRETEDAVQIPIAEEELVVGKRTVDRGGVRVYRRVVEEPVSEPLQLHEEHVVLERRPVDRAVTPEDLRTGEGTLELVETAEVPVVQKSARVVEEVHVGVVGTEHTERVNDTVRHTEVEIEPVDATDGRSVSPNVPYPGTDRKA